MAIIKQQLNTLLAKEMDRKDFLRHLGVGIVAVSGVSAIVRTLSTLGGHENLTQRPKRVALRGYGSLSYGGKG